MGHHKISIPETSYTDRPEDRNTSYLEVAVPTLGGVSEEMVAF
jgi:hypothetical protein